MYPNIFEQHENCLHDLDAEESGSVQSVARNILKVRISREPISSIQKSVLKGSPGIARHLDNTLYKLYGGTVFVAILALFR